MKTHEYLDAVRALGPSGSVYAAAKLLGMNEDTVRSYTLGRSYPDAFACARIAEVLDVPIEQVLADVNAEREKDPERRAYWAALARKFAACLVMGSAITIWPNAGPSAIAAETPLAFDLLQIMRRWVSSVLAIARQLVTGIRRIEVSEH